MAFESHTLKFKFLSRYSIVCLNSLVFESQADSDGILMGHIITNTTERNLIGAAESSYILGPTLSLVFLCVSLFFFSLSLISPLPSFHLSSSLRNWPVKFSWCDQQHFSKSTVTQPTRLLAHQKAAMAALTRPRIMQRQVSATCATNTTAQTVLNITTHAL